MKSRGILYLAFGREFDKLTAASARYSRRFTDLPFCVLTNLKKQNIRWEYVDNVQFIYIDLPTNKNRAIKVSLLEYTPFDETLFLDSDAVIQRSGIERLFNFLEEFDVCCQFFDTLYKNDKNFEQDFIKKTYDKLARILEESYPIQLYAEAAILFKKTESCREFFVLWKEFWELMGCGRDMPAFSFAVKWLQNRVKIFNGITKFATNKEDNNYFIQHKGFEGFEKKFGLPNYIDWNPPLCSEM